MTSSQSYEENRRAYVAAELSKVDASGEYPAKLQITSDAGSTKHLNITADQFQAICAVLTGEQQQK